MVIQVAAAQQLEKQSVDTSKTAVADAKREEQAAAQRASTAAHNAQLKEASALKVWDALVSTDSSIITGLCRTSLRTKMQLVPRKLRRVLLRNKLSVLRSMQRRKLRE